MSSLAKLFKVAHESHVKVKGLDLLPTVVRVVTALNDTVVNLSKPEASIRVAWLNLHNLYRTTNVEVLLVVICQIVGFSFPYVDQGETLARVDNEVGIHTFGLRDLADVHAVNSKVRRNNHSLSVCVEVEDHHAILTTFLK